MPLPPCRRSLMRRSAGQPLIHQRRFLAHGTTADDLFAAKPTHGSLADQTIGTQLSNDVDGHELTGYRHFGTWASPAHPYSLQGRQRRR